MKAQAPWLAVGSLPAVDLSHVTYLARDIRAVWQVLDDLVYSQLEYGQPGDDKWESVLHALTDFIGERSGRLVKELAKAEPRAGNKPTRKAVAS